MPWLGESTKRQSDIDAAQSEATNEADLLVGVVKTRATMGRPKRRPPSQWASRVAVAKTKSQHEVGVDHNSEMRGSTEHCRSSPRYLDNYTLSPQTAILAEDSSAATKKSGELPYEKMGGTVATEPTPVVCNIAATKAEVSGKYDELCKVPPKATEETKEALEVPIMGLLSPEEAITDEKLEAKSFCTGPSEAPTTICPASPATTMGPMGADVEGAEAVTWGSFPASPEANGKEKKGEESLSEGCRKEEGPDKRPQTIATCTATEERTRRERKNRTGALFNNLAQLRRRWALGNCNIL